MRVEKSRKADQHHAYLCTQLDFLVGAIARGRVPVRSAGNTRSPGGACAIFVAAARIARGCGVGRKWRFEFPGDADRRLAVGHRGARQTSMAGAADRENDSDSRLTAGR